MNKRIILFSLFIFIIKVGFCENQNKYEKIQGIWCNSGNGYFEDDRTVYYVFKSNNLLILSYYINDNLPDYFSQNTFGFMEFDPVEEDVKINVQDLKHDGVKLVKIRKKYKVVNGYLKWSSISVTGIGFDEDMLSIIGGNGNESRFYKVSHLPLKGNDLLYKQGLHDSTDYYRIYLDANISKISNDKVVLKTVPDTSLGTIILKNEIVEILSSNDSTVLVKYITKEDEALEGWISKNAVWKTQFSRKVAVPKTYIYKSPEEITKMYLIENDEIDLVEKVGDFWKMKYKTAKGKIIEGYVKRIDCI